MIVNADSHKMATLGGVPTSFSRPVTSLSSMIVSWKSLAVLFILINSSCIFLPKVEGFNCKFPNEGCDVNNEKECCSGKCVDLHPGTNARCTRLTLHKPCLYTYQCDDRLRCGTNNTCCAKYWGTCTEARDCCDPAHSCYEVEGFYYRRCLYASASAARVQGQTLALPTFTTSLFGREWNHVSLGTVITTGLCLSFVLDRREDSGLLRGFLIFL